jgi:lipoprotein-anchoring transpeptidase ErfK/SrfK
MGLDEPLPGVVDAGDRIWVVEGPVTMASAATRQRRRRAAWALGLTVVAALLLSACTSAKGGSPGSTSPSSRTKAPASSSSAAIAPAKIVAAPGATGDLSPAQPIKVSVTGGRLTAVSLVNPDGKSVSGSLTPEATSWQNAEVLGYSKTYTLTARAVNDAGVASTYSAKYTTVTPPNLTMPYFQYTGGYALQNGATYGVGIVPVIHFDEPISDKRAAMAALSVTTTPTVSSGAWYWSDDQTVHYRPQTYWPAGTKVTINASVYGKQISPGLYGQADASISFAIGAKHIAVADDRTHSVAVYFSDKLQRVMPTSMGRGGYVTGKNNVQISLWTMPGTYTVIAHENPAIMSSASYGLPANSPHGYGPEKVYWATKISTDGIYLHELTTTIWAQGHTDVSHGCLNLNTDNATWYFKTAVVGDVVEVKNTGGPGIQLWQGGEWSVPWSTWAAGGLAN